MNDFRRIVLTGAPGTGKSSTVNELAKLGYSIMPEVSREYWDKTGYGSGGSDPWRNLISFSEAIWKLRVKQYNEAKNLRILIPRIYRQLKGKKFDASSMMNTLCI